MPPRASLTMLFVPSRQHDTGLQWPSTGCQSLITPVSVAERDAWFAPRFHTVMTSLKGPPTAAGGRRSLTRAAAITAEPLPAATDPLDLDTSNSASATSCAAAASTEAASAGYGGLRQPHKCCHGAGPVY